MTNGREKGRKFQSWLAKRWRDSGLFPNAWSTQQPRGGPRDGADLAGTAPYSIEAKAVESINLWNAMEQAEAAAGDDMAVVVAKKNRQGILVCMRLESWEKLIESTRPATTQSDAPSRARYASDPEDQPGRKPESSAQG